MSIQFQVSAEEVINQTCDAMVRIEEKIAGLHSSVEESIDKRNAKIAKWTLGLVKPVRKKSGEEILDECGLLSDFSVRYFLRSEYRTRLSRLELYFHAASETMKTTGTGILTVDESYLKEISFWY